MTDILPTPEILATGSSGASAAQIASAREHWISLGYDAGQFDSAMAGVPESPTGLPAPVPNVHDDRAATGIEIMGGDKLPSLTQAQAHELADGLRAQGIPEDKITAALAEHGYTPLAPDTRTEHEREFDKAFPKPSPSSYNVNWREAWPEQRDIGTLSAANQEFTTWAADMELPPELGTAVIERAITQERAYHQMSEGERAMWKAEQRAAFARLAGGADKVEEKMAFARSALAKAAPHMVERLYRTGALHDAATVIHLAHHGERLAARSGKAL